MKLLLVQPPFLTEKISSLTKYSPMGLIAIAGYLRQNNKNLNIKIYDTNIERDRSIQATVKYILKHAPQILGLTAMSTNIEAALKIAKAVKSSNPKIIIVIGGVHATIAPKEVLSNKSVDFIIIGEGEITFNEFLENINNPKIYKNIDGLGYKQNGKIMLNKRRELIKDLDQLSIPAYDLLKIEKYRSPYTSKTPFINIIRSRGCPFRCIFCGVQSMFGHIYRCQSPQRTMEEIDYLIDKFKVKEIGFKDSEFTINSQNTAEFCELLSERRYNLTWSCNARVDCGSFDLYKKMKEAGCQVVVFGGESGDQNILDIIKKDITLEQIKQAVKDAKKAKLKVSVNFMLGNPNETKETITKTIKFAKQLNPDYVFFGFSTPFPGTKLRDMAIKNNWLIDKDLSTTTYTGLTMNATSVPTEELKTYLKKAYCSFYFRPLYILKRLFKLNKEEIKSSILGFLALIKTKG